MTAATAPRAGSVNGPRVLMLVLAIAIAFGAAFMIGKATAGSSEETGGAQAVDLPASNPKAPAHLGSGRLAGSGSRSGARGRQRAGSERRLGRRTHPGSGAHAGSGSPAPTPAPPSGGGGGGGGPIIEG